MNLNSYLKFLLPNNSILLQPFNCTNVDSNIDNNIILSEYVNNLLLQREPTLNNINSIETYNYKFSHIKSCSINDVNIEKLTYTNILKKIYDIIDDTVTIRIHTTLKVKSCNINPLKPCCYYMPKLELLFPYVCNSNTIKEIYYQSTLNNINIKMQIKLKNNIKILNLDI